MARPLSNHPSGAERQREVLREASVALGGRVVTLWEARSRTEVVALLSSVAQPPYHDTVLDLERTLHRWGAPVQAGSRWVGCRLDEDGHWCVAPVRGQPPAPPPGGVERRSGARMTLELAGLCVGLVDGAGNGAKTRRVRTEALVELSRQPSAIAHAVAHPLTTALMSLELSLERIHAADRLDATFRAGLLEELASVAEGMERSTEYLRAMQDRDRGEPARQERFDAAEVVRSCVVLERPLARRQGVTIQSAVGASEVFLRGDPNALYQILTHLVRNAVAASRESKTPVVVGLGQSGQAFRLMVQDRGVSLGAGELHPDRFEPRSWTALSAARQLAEEVFGGRVEVDTTRPGSTTFAIALPVPPQRGRGA